MLVWIDLETTGLAATQERVLEVACIITDDALVEIARFQRVTAEAKHHDLSKVDPYVLQMHVANGLWNESLLAPEDSGDVAKPACGIKHVDVALFDFIYGTIRRLQNLPGDDADKTMRDHVGEKKGPQLAGSTISFDRAFMQVHLPLSHALLSYRNLDVSSFNEIAKRRWPSLFDTRPRTAPESRHRALDDILDSLAVMRHYDRAFGRAIAAWGDEGGTVEDLVAP